MKDAIISLAWLINDVSIHYNKLSETTFQKSTLISKTKIMSFDFNRNASVFHGL